MLCVSDRDLQVFCEWYKNHFDKSEEEVGVFVVCLCGRFHTYPKRAKELLKRCKSLNLLVIKKNVVFLK